MKKFYLENNTLDDFVNYLKGTVNPHFDGISGNQLVLVGKHELSCTMEIKIPLSIVGEDATIIGRGCGCGILVSGSDVKIQDIRLQNCLYGVEIDARGSIVENVIVDNISVDLCNTGIEIGSSESNSIIRNVEISNCVVNVPKYMGEDGVLGKLGIPYSITSARNMGGYCLENCLTEKVKVVGCKINGVGRSLNIMPSVPARTRWDVTDVEFKDITLRDITIENNDLSVLWDSTINIMTGYVNCENILLENVKIANNVCHYANSAVFIFNGCAILGESSKMKSRGIIIINNHFIRENSDKNEPIRTIYICGSRSEIVPNLHCYNNSISDIQIDGNVIEGGGIVIHGAYCSLDDVHNHVGNLVSGIDIKNNLIVGAKVPLELCGGYIEGKKYDCESSYLQLAKHKHQNFDECDRKVYLANNEIRDINFLNNKIFDAECQFFVVAVAGKGNGKYENNKVSRNIIIKNNTYNNTLKVNIKNVCIEGSMQDDGGNEVVISGFTC